MIEMEPSTEEDKARATAELKKVDEFAKAMGWEYYQVCGLRYKPDGKPYVSVCAKGHTEHIAMMVMALVDQVNSKIVEKEKESTGKPLDSMEPLTTHPELEC